MRILLTTALLLIPILTCQENEEPNNCFILLEGTYQGTFTRSSPNTRWVGAQVTLSLEDGKFFGSSDTKNYPAICKGTYQLTGPNQINSENSCAWTADFDRTFLLSGDYQIRKSDQKIIISREYEESLVDESKLSILPNR